MFKRRYTVEDPAIKTSKNTSAEAQPSAKNLIKIPLILGVDPILEPLEQLATGLLGLCSAPYLREDRASSLPMATFVLRE